MIYVGAHLSSTGGNVAMVETAQKIGANTFAFFTRNPRGSRAKPEDPADCAAAVERLKQYGFGKLVAHGAYTMNLCTADPDGIEFASHVGQGVEAGIEHICKALKKAMEPEYPVTVLLEGMAGKGSEIGGKFEHLRAIIDGVGRDNIGVCLDTCHMYDAGYDIVHDLDGVLQEFDRIVGLDKLHAMHLNDSKNPFASHKDRHECLGQGSLGLETFKKIINHPLLKGKPMILETPNELPGYQAEIALLRQMEE